MGITNVVAPNLMNNVNQPLPANLRVTPKPIIGGADLKAITDQHSQVYQQAMNFGRMNPDVVLRALGDGGSLSNAFGFSNATDIAGLTPDQLMALTQGRGADVSLNNAQKTFDSVTGAPEQRAMMLQRADKQYGVNTQMLSQQNAQDLQAQGLNAGHQIDIGTKQATLDQGAELANAGFSNNLMMQREQIAAHKAIADQQNQRAIDNLRFQVQAHNENLKATLGAKAAEGQANRNQQDFKLFESLLLTKDSTTASVGQLNQLMMRHPEWNQEGTYYDTSNIFNNKPVQQKLTPATLKDGTKIWMKPDNTFFSIRP